MKFFLLFFILSYTGLLSQSLTVEETLEYIEYYVNEDLSNKRFYTAGRPEVRLDLIDNSIITIKYLWKGNKDVLVRNAKNNFNKLSFYLKDIKEIKGDTYDGLNTLLVQCESGDKRCFRLEEENLIKNYSYTFSDNPRSIGYGDYLNLFYFKSEIGRNNVQNALKYCVVLIKEQEKNKLMSDPFFNKDLITERNTKVGVPLKRKGNIFVLDANFSGYVSKVVLDSGASDVSVSQELAQTLLSKNIISKQDFLEPGLYKIANGSVVKSERFILPYLEIEGVKIENVKCSINDSENVVLLGKEFLDRFKTWKINNQTNILTLEF